MTPKVSVCIVVYNTDPDLLRKCLESIEIQRKSVDGLESIVFDNSANDLLKSKFETMVDSWIESSENLGFAVASNRCVSLCSGDWVLLLNPDAALEAGAIARLIEVANKYGGSNLYMGWLTNGGVVQVDAMMNWIYSSDRLLRRKRYQKWLSEHSDEDVVEVQKVSGGACFGDRRVLSMFGPFDDRFFLYGEDADLSLRAKSSGRSLYAVPSVVIQHTAASSQKSFSSLVEMARADAGVRLSAYHQKYALSLIFRMEFLLITLLGVFSISNSSSGEWRSRLRRVRVIREWGFSKDKAAWRPDA